MSGSILFVGCDDTGVDSDTAEYVLEDEEEEEEDINENDKEEERDPIVKFERPTVISLIVEDSQNLRHYMDTVDLGESIDMKIDSTRSGEVVGLSLAFKLSSTKEDAAVLIPQRLLGLRFLQFQVRGIENNGIRNNAKELITYPERDQSGLLLRYFYSGREVEFVTGDRIIRSNQLESINQGTVWIEKVDTDARVIYLNVDSRLRNIVQDDEPRQIGITMTLNLDY